jgi:pyruvate formate lyase activating enzyme
MKMYYGGMENVSLTDWPGEVATVIFFQGCPMKCPHCFNEAMLQPLGANLRDLKVIKDDLVSNPLISALVLSGGEPLMQPDAARELLVYAKSIGLKTAIETCGYYPNELVKLLINDLLDMVFIDVKSELTDGSQSIATGINDATNKVIDSLNICFTTTIPFEIRTTVFPNFPNTIELANLAMDIKKLKKEYPNNELQGHVLQQGIAKESETYFEPVLKATLANMQKVLDEFI